MHSSVLKPELQAEIELEPFIKLIEGEMSLDSFIESAKESHEYYCERDRSFEGYEDEELRNFLRAHFDVSPELAELVVNHERRHAQLARRYGLTPVFLVNGEEMFIYSKNLTLPFSVYVSFDLAEREWTVKSVLEFYLEQFRVNPGACYGEIKARILEKKMRENGLEV